MKELWGNIQTHRQQGDPLRLLTKIKGDTQTDKYEGDFINLITPKVGVNINR
jgi:hypothetical protein